MKMEQSLSDVSLASTFRADNNIQTQVLVAQNGLRNLDALGVLDNVRKESKHLLITDANVEQLYLRPVLDCIERSGRTVRTIVVPAEEASKSFEVYAGLVQTALDHGIDKYSVIFSLGGGLVNNLAGFLASTLYRGIGLIHLPTSLLAQVDAAIDFKQALNFSHGKNLIGSFYPASNVLIDPIALQTLNPRLIRCGLAESVKHALCQDGDFLNYIMSHHNHLDEIGFLTKTVIRSVNLKLEMMVPDLHSDREETIKQYGHAVGHAVEHLSGGEIYHGEAIAIGMCVSAEIGRLLGVTDEETVDVHYRCLSMLGLPTMVPLEFSLGDIWEKVRYDKHFLQDRAYMGLLSRVGVPSSSGENGLHGHWISRDVLFEAIEINRRAGGRLG
ncbi:2-deoxy-scyllo-inosose synthase [Rhodopseudomonas palustris]|uniref:3-dehydroquinate synthase n=1 Tax=Rhodopseudomonas palustris (strain BisB18) TaxID=316056 RepID=Q20YR8_RHOPB